MTAPDHPYPSYLELQLTATDSAGRTASASVALQPKTVGLAIGSVPSGLSLIVSGNDPAQTPYTATVIANSSQSLIAPETQVVGSTTYVFSGWSDGGAATHDIVAPTGGASYTATYAAGSTTSYLSDLAYSAVANGWGPVEKDLSNGEQAAGDGHPITLNGVVYAKGLGTHAASDVRYTMGGTCSLFTATVGVDDEVGANGSVVFQVFTDGTKVYDSGLLTGSSPSGTVSLNVTGKTALQLVVTNGGDNIDFDHADWADAKLTCGSTTDTTPPSVTGTSPANGATGVASSIAPSATFSEAIDPTTISTTTMTLTNQATSAAVAGSVAYNGTSHVATFSPSAALAAGTTYLARVKGGSTGVKDLAGNALAADVTWTFTTAALTASQVRIETAANGTGTVVPAQSLATGSAITGYAISRDSAGGFIANVPANWSLTSISGGVVATDLVVAGDAKSATFTGHAAGSAIIHPAVSGLTSVNSGTITVTAGSTTSYLSDLAYSAVANGWGPVEKDLSNGEQAAGDGHPITLNGVVYAKGLGTHAASDVRYTMGGTCSLFTATVGVDDEVGANGSVVFQVFTDGTKVYDSGLLTGSSPSGTVSLNVTGKTALQLVVTNGGDNIDFDHADWADAKLTCGSTTDTTPPSVTGTSPANGATGVASSIAPSATFSEAIDPTTISTTTMTLTNQATSAAVAGSVAYNGTSHVATFSPSAALAAGTTYLARVKGGSTGVKDLAGNALAADVTWTFTTAALTASQVRIETAANGTGTVVPAQSLATGSAITGYAISRDSAGGFIANVPANWSLTSISGGVVATDLVVAGDAKSATFTGHAAGSAIIHPAVSGLTSVDSGTITVTAGSTTSYLSDLAYSAVANGWGPVEKDLSNGEQAAGDGHPITLNGVVYAKGLGTHAASDVRYTMGGTCSLFTATVGVDDEVGANGSVVFQVFTDGTKVYDSGLLTGSSPSGTVSLNVTGKTALQLVVTNGGDNIDFDHADWADAKLTCGSTTDTTPPSVTGTSPANGATGVASSIAPSATFSEAIDPTTISTTTMTLTNQATSAAVAGSVAYNGTSHVATFSPSAALAAGTTYLARVKGGSTGVKDLAGNALAADVTWTFTTAALTASQVRIETAANGTGTVVPAQSLATGSAITGYAISRDSAGGFIANVPANWSLTSISGGVVATDLVVAGDAKSATFTGHAAGSAIIHPAVSGLTSVDSGTITVTAGSTTSYLSDLAYSAVANGWGPVEKDLSNGEQAAGDGHPITLNGVVYAKGLGTHAASDVRYTMGGTCSLFTATVGVDDEVGANGSVVFQVFTDGTKVYDSGLLTGSSPSGTVSLNVTGKTALQLVVTNGGDNIDFDHADWADAKLTCG